MISVNTDKLLKKYYVGASRSLRRVVDVVAPQDRAPVPIDQKYRIWLRSLLAIYDIDEMNRLDLAWWQLDALAEVDRFLRRTPRATVFEYGSGASTLWLARRAAAVTSIEHDETWYNLVSERLSAYANIRLRLMPALKGRGADEAYRSLKPGAKDMTFRDYVHAIDDEHDTFDLIVIDGRCRTRCLELARTKLKPGGMIVFDNSNRSRYRAGIEASGLRRARYWGLSACLPYPDETTLLRLA